MNYYIITVETRLTFTLYYPLSATVKKKVNDAMAINLSWRPQADIKNL